MYNDSLLKKIGKAKKLAEQDAKNAFLNGGYENAAKEIQSLSDEIYQANRSGKNVNPDKITELNNKLLRFNSFAATAGFDDKTRESLLGMGRSYVSLKDALKANNDTLTSRNTTYKQIDDIGKQQFKNIWFGMESNKEKDQAEAMRLREKKSKLKEKVAQYNRDIAPYLDVEATKKRLDNTSFFDFKAHDRAKTDYQNAREQKTGREAEEWLQDKEVKQLSVQAGTAAAAQETIDSSGNKANLKAAKEARTFTQNREKLKSTIKGRGYKDSDDELDKLVDEIIRRGKMDVTEKQQSDINKKLQEYTKAHPVIGSFAAAAAGTVAKVPGAKYALSQAIKGFVSDERVYNDPNSAYFFGSNAYNQVTTAVKDEIAKHIKNKYDDPEVIKSKIKDAQMMYDGAMSGLENVIRAVTTAGVGEVYALVPMALAQLSDIALQKTIEGYSPTDAGYYAFIGAVAEYATEKMGIDALFSKVPGGRNVIVGYLSKLLKVGAAEGAEEVVSDVINDAADCLYELLSDKKSAREKEISHLMRKGMSYKEAAEAYTHNKINEYIDDAVMGAAVGAVLGGGSTAVNITAKTANIARNIAASKQQAQAVNQQTVNAIQAEFGGRLTAEAAADVAKERGQWVDGNAYYENLIEQAKNSYDPKVAQMGIDAEDDYRYQKQMKDGRVSIAKAGRLINHISAANIRATTGMATQMLESVGAKSGTVKAVINAINGEELSRRDIKNIKNSPDALSMLSQLYQDNTGEAIFLSAKSDNDTIREVAGEIQGATFNIDRNTDAGKMYSMAAGLRSENKLGFNGVQGFVNSYSPDLGLDDEGYSLMYQQAYSLAKSNEYSNMKPEEKSRAIADAMTEDFLEGIDNVQMYARVAAISSAVADAQNDVSLERKKSKETSEAEADPDEDTTQKENSALGEDTSEADPVTKEVVESAKKLSRLSEIEKAEKYKNGGAIVESTKKLTTQQSAIISFYDYRGKKHGITYRFVDKVVNDARGTYKDNIITIQINGIEDMTSAAGHELGHYLQENFPEEYKALQDYIKNTLFKQKGISFEEEILKTIENYKENDQNIDRDMAFEEITNDCLFGVDMASSEYEEFVRANETLMQKAFRVIRELLQDLQHFMEDWRKQLPGLYKKVTNIDMIQALYDDVEFMEYTADWVDGILNRTANEVAKNENEVAKNENTTAQSAERFSFGNSKAGEQRDKAYMQAAQNGDEAKAAEYVEQAAKEWGAFSDGKPAPINLYHGTKSFGFTEFDLQKMDDKRSIFLTSDLTTASTYSANENISRISESKDKIDTLDGKKLAEYLTEHNPNRQYHNANVTFSFLTHEDTAGIVKKAKKDLIKIAQKAQSVLREHENEISIIDKHRLENLALCERDFDFDTASAQLYLLNNQGDAGRFLGIDDSQTESIRIGGTFVKRFRARTLNTAKGVVLERALNGNSFDVYEMDAARKLAKEFANSGNYSLYAKFNNPFVIDNEGRLWRDIKLNEKSAEQLRSQEQRDAIKRMREFISVLEKDSEWTDEGFYSDNIFKSDKTGRETRSNLRQFMTDAYNGEFVTDDFPWGEYKEKIVFASDMLRLNNAFDYDTSYTTREIAEKAQKAGYDGVVFKNIRDNGGAIYGKDSGVADYIAVAFDSSQVKSADPVTYDDNGEIIPLSERFSDDKDIRYSFGNKKITPNMSDEERAEVLKNTELSPVDDKSEEYGVITSDYDGIKSKIEKPLRDKLREIGAFRKYSSKAIDFDFEFTAIKGYKKSTHQQLKYGGDYHDLAKVLSNLQELLEKAVLIETHFDRDIGTKFEKPYAKQFYILMSVLKEGNFLIPVQFEIIEYLNNDNKLYVAVAMSKIAASDIMEESISEKEKEVDVTGNTSLEEQDGTDLLSTSTYSIRDIFKNINPVDKLFLKYVPDEFLNEEQIAAKREALDEEKKRRIKTKSSDNAYMQAVENGNNQEQQRLVDEAAEKAFSKSKIRDEKGKLIKVYHGTFADFTEFDSSKGRTNMDIRGSFFSPWDIDAAGYGPNVRAFYLNITNPAPEAVAYKALNSHKGENGAGEKARNDLIKMGYNGVNNSDEEYIAFYPEQIKSADPVTYDDNGEVIPLSERFSKSKDYRYQFANTLTPEQQAAIERKAQRREMAKLERENENLKAALDAALKQTKLSKDFRHDESKTAQIAKKLLRKFGVRDVEDGDNRFNRFVEALNKFYDTIDDSKLEGTGGSDVTYMAALEAIESVRDSLEETDYTNADYLRDFLSDIGTPDSQGRIRYIYLNEDAARSVLENYGSFRNVISHTGNIHFKALQPGESHATLDEIWESEIAGKWGDVVTGASEMSTDGLIDLTDSTMQAQVLINAIENARDVVQGRNTYNPLGDKTAFEAADEIIDGETTSDEAYIINEMIMDLYESYNDAEWQATFADKKANKERVKYLQYKSKLRQSMDRYRRQVNERNETYRQKIEKNYKERYQKAISRNDLRVQMEKERLAAYKEKVAENRKKATERKKQTEIKNKIRKLALELARLGGDPNKKKHLPNGLVKVTKEFLELIDTGDRNNGKLSQYVYNINTEFARIEGHPGYDALSDSYNNMIKGQIEEIAVEIGHKNLNELTSSELQKVWECAKTIKHSVVHMNRFFLAEKNATPEQYQQRLLQERKGKDSKKELVAAMGLKRFIDNDLKPYYFFNKLQSPTMNKLYDALRTGQDTWATDIQEGEDAIVAFKEKYNYNSWDQRKKYEFKLESGQTVSLNLQQIMSLRAYADREASYGHIYIGGIKLLSGTEATRHLKDKVTQRLDNTRYEISPADLEKITRTLSKEQTAYVIAMRNYLSSLGEKGNQVSRALFDLELFKEINYFPMRSSQEYTRQGEFKETGEKKLKNWGNAKPLVPGADNPLVIEEFNDVWARHVNEMALYHAFTLPLEDFQKVYGYYKVVKPAEEKELRKNFSDEKAFEEHMPTTASIRNLFSVSEQQYISQFLRNLNGGVKKADNTLSGRGIAKYKKMSTALNLRVAVQQPGAIARAFLYINPKYFAKTAGKGFTGFKSDSKTVQEMEKYSGAAFIKSMGYFDVDTGKTAEEFLLESGDNYKGAQKVKGFFFDGKYRDSLLLMGPEVMDRITWVQIWEATKAKVAAEEGLTGKALLKRTGKVFSDVVDKTQVYDSVFTRSGHMRSTDALAKMATSFMAEPTTTINMIYDAVTQCRAGKVNKKFVAGAFASCFTATLFTNLLASVVSAFRHGKKDDNWWELWTGEFTADALNDIILLNSLPIVRDIYNLAKGFDIERADMTLISDWVSSVQKLNEASQKGKLTYKEWINFLSSSAVMLGLPLKSLYKDINGIFTAYQIVTNGTSPTREGIRKAIKKGTLDTLVADDFLPIAQPSTNKYDTIYLLYAGGNKKEAEKRKKILFKYDEKATQDKLDAYIKGQLKENKDVIRAADALRSGDLSKTKSELSKIKNFDKEIVLKAMVQIVNDQVNDEEKVGTDTLVKVSSQKSLEQNVLMNNKLVRQAAIALNKNDDEARYNAQRQLVNQGFKIDDVVKVTRTIKNKMFPGEKKENTSSKNGMKYFQYTDVADALKANKAKFARDVVKKLESDYAKDGKSAADVHKQVRSKITSTFKEEYYMANESRRAEIRKLMWASGAYDSVDDVTKACKKWVKDVAKKKYSN